MKSFLSSGQLTPPNPIVKRLMEMKKHSNDPAMQDIKWCEKAVKSLVKKVKRSNMTDELIKSITLQDPSTSCITIPRSLDGRVQVCQRKGIPHVIYCRIWRFPDIQSHHQLKPVPHCMFAYHYKKDEVCVNPYHYEKNDATSIPPILVPKLPYPSTFNSFAHHHQQQHNAVHTNVMLSTGGSYGLHQSISGPAHYGNSLNGAAATPFVFQSTEGGTHPRSIFKLEDADSRQPESSRDMGSVGSADSVFAPANIDMNPKTEQPNSDVVSSTTCAAAAPAYSVIEYNEPTFWCSVSYHELNQRLGETFHASQPLLIVDGFVDPSNAERFCLGLLSNINRPSSVVEVRKHIGKGAKFYVNGGDVYVECLSDHAIFVQSPSLNLSNGFAEENVYKLPAGYSLKVFNNAEFARLLSECVRRGFERVYDLTRMCAVRLSFVKGWGAQYRRQTITSTPCWIELHLNGPYQWLDRVLREMRPSSLVHSDT